jgi:RNA polymerase sigma factor for flagellar operon FliA
MDENDVADIVRQYGPYVRSKATALFHVLHRVKSVISVDDLYQAGISGVLYACRAFREEEGAPFSAFVILNIKYSLYNEAHSVSSFNATAFRDKSRIERGRLSSERIYERNVSMAEVADILGSDEGELCEDLTNIASRLPAVISLEDDEFREEHLESDQESVVEAASMMEMTAILHDALARSCTDIEQSVLRMIYWEGMTYKSVGNILGVSRQRACRIAKNATKKLQKTLKKMVI